MTKSEKAVVRRIVREEVAAALRSLTEEMGRNLAAVPGSRELDAVAWSLEHTAVVGVIDGH